MSPAALLLGLLAWLASVGAAGWWAYGAGQDKEIAAQAREDKVGRHAAEIAAGVSAEAIGKLEVKNVTINRALERVVETHEVFRDCHSGADAVRMLNATIGATAASAPDAAGGGQLPASGAAR